MKGTYQHTSSDKNNHTFINAVQIYFKDLMMKKIFILEVNLCTVNTQIHRIHQLKYTIRIYIPPFVWFLRTSIICCDGGTDKHRKLDVWKYSAHASSQPSRKNMTHWVRTCLISGQGEKLALHSAIIFICIFTQRHWHLKPCLAPLKI